MTVAAALAFLKFLIPFIAGWLTNHGIGKLAASQAANQNAEQKASDPASGNDVTDLDKI